HREQLTRFGIELSRLRPVAPGHAVEAVRELTVTALEKHHPLPAIVVRLRDEADGLVPQGTSPYSERVGRICPDGAVRRLRQPPAVLPAAMSPGLLAATFAACLLSGLWPAPVALSGVIAVLGVGAGAAWVSSKASAIVPVPARLGWRFVLSQLAAAVAGSACGVALSRAGSLPVPAGPAGIASGAGVAVVVVFGLTMLWWSVLAGRWYASLHLRRLTGVADMLRSLVVEVARDEWQMAGDRAAASNYARVMAGIVDDAVSSLRDYASGLPDPGRGGGTRANPQAHERVSREIVLLDLGDAVADSVGRLAASVGFGSLKAADGDMVQRELDPALHAYQAHLDTVGLHEPPPFARASEERSTLVKSLMERRSDMQELIRSDVRDERITQLCAPEQLTLFETDPLSAELITFAPRAARDFTSLETSWKVGRNAREHLIEWTSGSPVAGLLRLVPLRARAVEAEWPAETTSGGTTIRGGWRPPSPQEEATGE
ncbi:MAG TPA: hypothetical protein VN961_16450, partial [Streptosporangiaceae bacterium]|nr:hypothetical protein [Streptosporangiaceae bacterium]